MDLGGHIRLRDGLAGLQVHANQPAGVNHAVVTDGDADGPVEIGPLSGRHVAWGDRLGCIHLSIPPSVRRDPHAKSSSETRRVAGVSAPVSTWTRHLNIPHERVTRSAAAARHQHPLRECTWEPARSAPTGYSAASQASPLRSLTGRLAPASPAAA